MVLEEFLVEILGSIGLNVPLAAELSPSAYVGLLTAAAQVSGIFIGVYFAAVSVVASGLFSAVPERVRQYILDEKTSNVYIGTIIVFAASSWLLLALDNLGKRPTSVNLGLTSLLGAIAILASIPLARGLIRFVDPISLIPMLLTEMWYWTRLASVQGTHWNDQSFQHYYFRQAREKLSIITDITDLPIGSPSTSRDFAARASHQLLNFLRSYETVKHTIPASSFWFRRTFRHPRWLTASYSLSSVALTAFTALRPTELPDTLWLESDFGRQLAGLLGRTVEPRPTEVAIGILDDLAAFVELSASRFRIEEAAVVVDAMRDVIAGSRSCLVDNSASNQSDHLLILAYHERMMTCYQQLVVSSGNAIRSLGIPQITAAISRMNWTDPASVYATILPPAVVDRIEEIRLRLELEVKVEGELVTSEHHLGSLVVDSYLQFVRDTADSYLRLLEKLVSDFVKPVTTDDSILIATQVCHSCLEITQKVQSQVAMLVTLSNEIQSEFSASDLVTNRLDADELQRSLHQIRSELLSTLSGLLPQLARQPIESDMPDFLGRTFAMLAEETMSALNRRDKGLFDQLFDPFFYASLSVHDQVRLDQTIASDERLAVISIDPIMDVMTISGYAFVYAEISEQDFSEVVNSTWDAYVSQLDDPSEFAQYLATLVDARSRVFMVTPRDMVRTSWQQRFRSALGTLDDSRIPISSPNTEVTQLSPESRALFHVITRGLSHYYDGVSIFFLKYFIERSTLDNVKWPSRAVELREAIRRYLFYRLGITPDNSLETGAN